MSRQVNLYEAKTQLSRLVEEAADGHIIIIAKDGKPMAKLGPISGDGPKPPRRIGQLAENAKGADWVRWWQEWKQADREIEAEFEAAVAKPLPGARPKRRKRRR